jgi:hypothetical protein
MLHRGERVSHVPEHSAVHAIDGRWINWFTRLAEACHYRQDRQALARFCALLQLVKHFRATISVPARAECARLPMSPVDMAENRRGYLLRAVAHTNAIHDHTMKKNGAYH